jgi:hypothetical protein
MECGYAPRGKRSLIEVPFPLVRCWKQGEILAVSLVFRLPTAHRPRRAAPMRDDWRAGAVTVAAVPVRLCGGSPVVPGRTRRRPAQHHVAQVDRPDPALCMAARERRGPGGQTSPGANMRDKGVTPVCRLAGKSGRPDVLAMPGEGGHLRCSATNMSNGCCTRRSGMCGSASVLVILDRRSTSPQSETDGTRTDTIPLRRYLPEVSSFTKAVGWLAVTT